MSRWIKCSDKLPEKKGEYLTINMDNMYPHMRVTEYSTKWNGWNCIDLADEEDIARAYEQQYTHWMPLPEKPEVEA